MYVTLLNFYATVDAHDKPAAAHVTDGAARQKQTQAKDASVPKVERNLEETVHVRLGKEVVYGVEKDIDRARAA